MAKILCNQYFSVKPALCCGRGSPHRCTPLGKGLKPLASSVPHYFSKTPKGCCKLVEFCNSLLNFKFKAGLILNFYNFLAVIISARFTNFMRHLKFVALGAFHHIRRSKLPIGTSFISSGFRYVTLRYCHVLHLHKIIRSNFPCSLYQPTKPISDRCSRYRSRTDPD